MQPADPECVQNLTLPASAATAKALRGAIKSFPSCAPCERGAPKSFVYCTFPTTGKTIRSADTRAAGAVVCAGFGFGLGFVAGPGPPSPGWVPVDAAATPAVRPSARMRESPPRAVVRWRRIKLRFALEGRNPSKGSGGVQAQTLCQIWLEVRRLECAT